VDKPVLILGSREYSAFLTSDINPFTGSSPLVYYGITETEAISAIRRAELDMIVETSRARLPNVPGNLCLAPSTRLMRSFLRVGDVQYSRAALEAFFFGFFRTCATVQGYSPILGPFRQSR
jgi:hypothetical protein